jgi:hypothetical protein
VKFTLRQLGEKVIFSKSPKHFLDMGSVIFEVLRINQNIVEVNDYVYFDNVSEDIIDEILKSGRSIAKPKGHHSILVTTESGSHSRQPFMTFGDSNQIIGTSKIELREVRSSMKKSKKVRHGRNWVSILSSNIIQLPVIHTESEGSILLRDKKHRRTCIRLAWSKETFSYIFRNVVLKLSRFLL